MRINKYLATQKIASRREADALVAAGAVLINGQPAEMGQKVTATDTVEVTTPLPTKRVLAYYKPRGVITHSPAAGEVDIATQIKLDHGITGLAPVGRLDKDSEGLILLTDDGRITGPLLDPEAGFEKVYEVSVDKEITPRFCKKMEAGVFIEDYLTKPAVCEQKSGRRFVLTITEGKKHQIRRMCAALGYQVWSLRRVRIMHITLANLTPGEYKEITGKELASLYSQLGIS